MQKIVNLSTHKCDIERLKNKRKNFGEFLKHNTIDESELVEPLVDREEFESVEDIINFYSGKDNKTLTIKSID